MKFDLTKAMDIIERTPAVLNALTEGVAEDWIYQNEGGDSWSVFDVIGHLIICEKTDFMSRIEIVLSDSEDKAFAPIDMFAHFESNKGKTLTDVLKEFETLRAVNIQKLNALQITEGDLYKTGMHPKIGPTTLKELLATWVAHDLSHISQIARVMAKQLRDEVGPFISLLTILR